MAKVIVINGKRATCRISHGRIVCKMIGKKRRKAGRKGKARKGSRKSSRKSSRDARR
ncbi:MAG: hypothetical protein Q7R39_04540 [Dehalococcoidia bacterium]|nr:hypothetical protein [Dehalococcoidia bacterium]